MTYTPEPSPPADAAEDAQAGTRRRSARGCLLEIVETLAITVLIYLVIHTFVAQPFEVSMTSMEPTINDSEYVLIDKISPRFDALHHGDIIVFQPPAAFARDGIPFIKRVIGVPGDTVSLRGGSVYVAEAGGTPVKLDEPYVARTLAGDPEPTQPRDVNRTSSWTVPDGMLFVLGDNRRESEDSRFFGPISRDSVIGRAWLRYFPLDRIGFIASPVYANLAQP